MKVRILFLLSFWINICILRAGEGELNFGFQLKPIVPLEGFRTQYFVGANGSKEFDLNQQGSMNGGMLIRKNLTKVFIVGTGIGFVNRKYKLSVIDHLTSEAIEDEFTFVSYEVPVELLVNVRLGNKWYMNTGSGVSAAFFPSNIYSYKDGLQHITNRSEWSQLQGLTTVGFELRTSKQGIWYFGFQYVLPFSAIGSSEVTYTESLNVQATDVVKFKLHGRYTAFELRYYFSSK